MMTGNLHLPELKKRKATVHYCTVERGGYRLPGSKSTVTGKSVLPPRQSRPGGEVNFA
jgi:hypothetical protein